MLIEIELDQRVLTESELGTALTCVPQGYQGPTWVHLEGRSSVSLVLPTVEDAEAAAKFAVSDLGGYHTARILPAPGTEPSHATWRDWAFE